MCAAAHRLHFPVLRSVPSPDGLRKVECCYVDRKNGSERRERAMHLLQSVDLADRAQHRPDQLSGGQQQRVAIARALATDPTLILADEPTANLDTPNGKQIMEIMTRLNQETGVTFVFATHDPRVISYARRVITLRDGLILENHEAEQAVAGV